MAILELTLIVLWKSILLKGTLLLLFRYSPEYYPVMWNPNNKNHLKETFGIASQGSVEVLHRETM